MTRYIKLTQKVYKGKQYFSYANSVTKSTELDPEESWKADLPAETALPTPIYSTIYIDPTKITTFCETFSLEQSEQEDVEMDSIDISLEHGPDISVVCTMQEFLAILESFYSGSNEHVFPKF